MPSKKFNGHELATLLGCTLGMFVDRGYSVKEVQDIFSRRVIAEGMKIMSKPKIAAATHPSEKGDAE